MQIAPHTTTSIVGGREGRPLSPTNPSDLDGLVGDGDQPVPHQGTHSHPYPMNCEGDIFFMKYRRLGVCQLAYGRVINMVHIAHKCNVDPHMLDSTGEQGTGM